MNEEQPPTIHEGEDRSSSKKNARDNLRHAGEFTKIENTAIIYVLRGWFGALIKPEAANRIVEIADDLWATQTLLEHFDSELNSDPSTRTQESRAVLAELKTRAKAAQERLNATLGTDTNDDERVNALTDKIVQEVIDKLGL